MKVDTFEDREYWTAESAADLDGWDCSLNREYKPGVHLIHAIRCFTNGDMEMHSIYCRTEILADYESRYLLPKNLEEVKR